MAGSRYKIRGLALGLLFFAVTISAQQRPGRQGAPKQLEVDALCQQLRLQFRDTQPYFFSGPDPWMELSELPQQFDDEAVATLYFAGASIRWVVLEMTGTIGQAQGPTWYQKVNYYFDSSGQVLKRERHFEQESANTGLDESTYYAKGHRPSVHTVHRALAKGPEDWSQLFDPEAPEYLSVNDLPFPPVTGMRDRLASRMDTAAEYALY